MTRPQGRPTRGKTAPNRLRRIDRFVTMMDSQLLRRSSPHPVVDLGFGRLPLTTLEMARTFRVFNATLPVLGVEIDPDRVEAAQAYAQPGIAFRRGGFNIPLQGHPARLIRAMNVLRQYPEEDAIPAHHQLIDQMMVGGLLVEGTCSPFGRRIVVNLIRKGQDGQPKLEGLLFSLNFREGFSPDLFPPVLPKQLIHRHIPGQPIHDFFSAWRSAAERTRFAQSFGLRQHFMESCRLLAVSFPGVSTRKKHLQNGFLLWRNPPYP